MSHETVESVERSSAQPIGARVLVRIAKKSEISSHGLIVPETAHGLPREGTVVAIGPGKLNADGERIPMELKVGDRVLFGKYVGTEVKVDGRDHIELFYDDVDGIIE